MSKGDAEILMDFKTGGAANANMVANSVYRNHTTGMRRVKNEASLLMATMSKAGGAVAGMATLSTGVQILNQFAISAEKTAQALESVERAVIPLSSLGDNFSKMGEMRRHVAELTAAADAGTVEVGQFLFNLQSTTGNLSASMRDQLKNATLDMAEATGGNLATAVDLVVKSYQIYGKEVQNVTELSNKLMFTQDQAALTFEQLATRLPELAGAGQVVGVSLNEVLASIIGATKKSGSIEKSFTGMRNVFLLMEKAQEKGVELTGQYTNKLAQLREQFSTNGAAMRDLFGQETVVAAKLLSDSVDDVKSSLEALEGITGDSSKAVEIMTARLEDATSRMVRLNQANARFRQVAPTLAQAGAEGSGAARFKRRGDLGALGAQVTTGGTEDSWSAWYGRWFGGEGMQAKGRAAEILNTAPGPLRDVMLQENFEARRRTGIRDLVTPGGMGGAPAVAVSQASRDQLSGLQAAQFDPAAELSHVQSKYPELMNESVSLLREIRDSLKNTPPGNTKPGGARTNYEETL